MSRIDLQPGTALAEVTAAQGAGHATAAATATASAGPVATGALSLIDAAAGLADFGAATADTNRAGALGARSGLVGTAATTAVATLVAIDETNAEQLRAAATGL
jgi:hypothetical protein